MFQSFEDLDVWKRSCKLAVRVYEVLQPCRDYALKDQMQRAAVSIASNIAEGSERTKKDFARFLTMAKGSAAELRTQIYIAAKIGILTTAQMNELVDDCKDIARMLYRLRETLKRNT